MSLAPVPGSELAGYRLESVLGRGGMGVVYVAEERALGRRVALKLLAPELAADEGYRERFLREMRLAASLEHPHVLPVYAAGEADGQLFLALRLVPGEDLASLLRREGALPPERALALLRQVAAALDAAHAAGLLHRDVKPANVLLTADGHAYLADFGLARTSAATTATSVLAGTAAYLAPELIEGRRPGAESDRYAFACLVHECLAGRPPFVREVEAAVLFAHLREDPPALPAALRAADRALARALAKKPDERPASCAELVDALAEALAPAPAAPRAPLAAQVPLPAPPTPLVGRERELAEADAVLARPDVRLLTLTGPGGTGKTRLALALAERAAPRYRDGARFVALAALTEAALVPSALAAGLGVSEQAGVPPAEALREALDGREVLLFLDNLEQLLPAAPFLGEVLAASQGVTMLVTSRAPLRLAGEHEYAVPPLVEAEAAELFVARARVHDPGLVADDDAVTAIVRRLDALPLALELAAARVRLLGVAGLRSRLEQALPLLVGGARDLPERQRTLRGAIDWSFGLLAPPEQRLFARLSVFAGTFALEAAEQVCDAGLDALATLVEHALLRQVDAATARFRMLQVIREYAEERLEEAGEAAAVRRRHAEWCVELAERAEPELRGPAATEWLPRLDVEHDNLRAALRWCAEAGETELELRLAGALHHFWHVRGHWTEGRAWLEAALERGGDAELRDTVLRGASNLARRQGDHDRARAYSEERLALNRAAGRTSAVASSLLDLGALAVDLGEHERAAAVHEEALALSREIGYTLGAASSLNNLGYLALGRGELDTAERMLREALELYRGGDPRNAAMALLNLGFVAVERRRGTEAAELLVESVRVLRGLGDPQLLAYSLLGLAAVAADAGDGLRAARLLGAADGQLAAVGASREPFETALRERTLARARELVGDARVESELTAGAVLEFDAAVEAALEPAPETTRPATTLPTAPTGLVGRERELAEAEERLLRPDVRLLTLTGPGGTGKTRLALALAERAGPRFSGGARFVSLASVTDAELVPSSVAAALDVVPAAGEQPADAIARALADAELLLVLDNLEQLLAAAPAVAALVGACPRLTVLATSRARLRVGPEHEYAVPPLAEPEAVELLRRRVLARDPGLRPDDAALAAVARRLDCLPLALELAAARVRLLGLDGVLERLDAALPLLTGGLRDAPERQRTLRATIDWSYGLLAPEEQALLARLSVFAGAFTLEAAEAVCESELDALESLVEHALVRRLDAAAGELRFQLLHVVREYAGERLGEGGDAVRRRHFDHVRTVATDANARMLGTEQAAQMARLARDYDEVRAALGWALDAAPDEALAFVPVLQRFWYLRGYAAEGLRWAEAALERAPVAPARVRARALRTAGTLGEGVGDYGRARALLEESVALLRPLGDAKELGISLNNVGAVATRQGDYAGARGFFAESLDVKRALGDRHGIAMTLSNLGMLEAKHAEYVDGRAHQEEALELMRELGDDAGAANALAALGELALLEEQPAAARAPLEESLALSEHVGDPAAQVEALALLARVALAEGDADAAVTLASRTAEQARDLDDAYSAITALEAAADVLAPRGALARAVSLRAAAARLRAEVGAPEWESERLWSGRTHELARAGLGAAELERARADGEAAAADEALAWAVAVAEPDEDRPSSQLPKPPTPLVGRQRELAEAEALLLRDDVRLLTLTGPGGTGKTRLGLALAERAAPRFGDGARFASLASLAEPELLPSALAAALAVDEEPGRSLLDAIRADLGEREQLLCLDNLEQLLDAAPFLADVLAACPHVKLLVTSRAPLRLAAEHEYAVPPLAEDEAVALFRARAQSARPDAAADANDETVRALVRRLDGLPLAVELAAARVRLLAPAALLARLDEALPLLTGGPRDAPARHQTLRATIDWSHDLLAPAEQRLLARLSVFAGGSSLESAERVCGATLDDLEALVEHSLVRRREGPGGEPRFLLLRVIREYALERLAAGGEEDGVRGRHAALFLELAERWEDELRGPEQPDRLRRFEAEQDDFRAALTWAGARGDGELEVRLAGALARFWYLRGLVAEGTQRLEHALGRGAGADVRWRIKALNAAGSLARVRGDTARADELAAAALEAARASGDGKMAARSLTILAGSAALAGDLERATELCEESVALFRELGEAHGVAVTLANAAELALARGDHGRAEELLLESVELGREHADGYALPLALNNLGLAALAQGRVEEGIRHLRESLERNRDVGYEEGIASNLEGLGIGAILGGDAEHGASLLGTAEALREAPGLALGFAERPLHERAVDLAREQLGRERLDAAWQRGRRLSRDDAVAAALEG